MTDRIVEFAWRTSILGLIGLTGVAALILTYSAFLEAIAMHWRGVALPGVLGMGLGVASYLLCRNRNDLIYC
ncbi:MAG TPA: hypothetical protein VL282_06475 [Tepidisphaeraceae bacterium]|jgi:hypothetical protein|nr:hypothetical protein [Tepidisphaeraceae bacterium]